MRRSLDTLLIDLYIPVDIDVHVYTMRHSICVCLRCILAIST